MKSILLTFCSIYARRWFGYYYENAGRWRIRCLSIINWRNFSFRRCKCRCIVYYRLLYIINNSNSRYWYRCKIGEFFMFELNDFLIIREL